MEGITLDIVNRRHEIIEVITFGAFLQVKRPMFSILNALQSLRGKFDFIGAKNTDISLYINLQKVVIEELLESNINSFERLLEPYGYTVNDYIENSVPIDFDNVKRFVQLEVMLAIDEFTRYLHPEAIEYRDASQGTVRFKGKTPSEKYTEVMEGYTSFMGSSGLLDEMINTFKDSIGIRPDSLLDNETFIPTIKSKRYSQVSDDIRYISINMTRKKEFKAYEPDQLVYAKNKLKSKSYYSNNGIFPLLWAEIKFAIENDIFARQCICGKYFELKKNNMMKKYCNAKCRDEQRKKNDMKNPNYDELVRLKKRKSRLKKKLIECSEKMEKEKFQNMIIELQKEIDVLNQY